jgi:predicted secreted protein
MSGGFYGRKVKFEWDGDEIEGIREKSLTLNGEQANVSSDEDDGVRHLLAEDDEFSIDFELSGVTKSSVLRVAKINGNIQEEVTITYPNGDEIKGTFNLGAYTEGQPYNDATTFSATLHSTGDVTFTAGTN